MSAYGEGATALVSKERFRFLVDEPPKLGGKGLGAGSAACMLRAPSSASAPSVVSPLPPQAARKLAPRSSASRWTRVVSPPLPHTPAGPNPLSLLLGSLVGCTQFTCDMLAREAGHAQGIGAAQWTASGAARPPQRSLLLRLAACPSRRAARQALSPISHTQPRPSTNAGEYDLRGVRGGAEGVDARFRRVRLEGTFDTDSLSQADLDRIAEQAGWAAWPLSGLPARLPGWLAGPAGLAGWLLVLRWLAGGQASALALVPTAGHLPLLPLPPHPPSAGGPPLHRGRDAQGVWAGHAAAPGQGASGP